MLPESRGQGLGPARTCVTLLVLSPHLCHLFSGCRSIGERLSPLQIGDRPCNLTPKLPPYTVSQRASGMTPILHLLFHLLPSHTGTGPTKTTLQSPPLLNAHSTAPAGMCSRSCSLRTAPSPSCRDLHLSEGTRAGFLLIGKSTPA